MVTVRGGAAQIKKKSPQGSCPEGGSVGTLRVGPERSRFVFPSPPPQISLSLRFSRGIVAAVQGHGLPMVPVCASLGSFCASPGGLQAAGTVATIPEDTREREREPNLGWEREERAKFWAVRVRAGTQDPEHKKGAPKLFYQHNTTQHTQRHNTHNTIRSFFVEFGQLAGVPSWDAGALGADAVAPVEACTPARFQQRAGSVWLECTSAAIYLRLGWDLGLEADQVKAQRRLSDEKPHLLILSPMCLAFSQLQALNTTPEPTGRTAGMAVIWSLRKVRQNRVSSEVDAFSLSILGQRRRGTNCE